MMADGISMKETKGSQSQALVLPLYLPEEIITTEILTRLPVKTLIRFKCVSKSWLLLISDPSFIKSHLANSSKSFTFANQKIILRRKSTADSSERDSYYLKSCSLDSILHPPFDNGILGDGHSLQLDYKNEIVGSCNGLICILIGNEAFLIWNPSTGESKRLATLEKSISHSTFGFGYDKLNDDYKVMQVEFDSSSCKKVIELYSLQTNSWKKIGDFPSCVGWTRMSKFVNGALHWLLYHSSRTDESFVIFSLHLRDETYGEVAQPTYGGRNCSPSLIVVEGCISLCCDFNRIRADIWVMKEYGVGDSWVKLYTFQYMHIPRKYGYFQEVVFCDSVTGEILVKHDEMLTIYYPKYGTYTNKRIQNMLCSPKGATTYVESLVSP